MISYVSAANPKRLRGTALLRLDFNTEDDWRMRAVLPTIKFLLQHSDKIVIVSHKGRPEGFEKKFSLKKDAAHLSKMLGRKVQFIDHFRFAAIRGAVKRAPHRSIFLLENLRFLPGEEKNDPNLARHIASLADFYVNDAFAVCHRANASVVAITKFLPSYAGIELEREITSLSRVMVKPRRPLVVILGGAKAADKLGVIKFFEKKADQFLLGGGPANTILAMRGMDIKKSVHDADPDSMRELKKLIASEHASQRIMVPEPNLMWDELVPIAVSLIVPSLIMGFLLSWLYALARPRLGPGPKTALIMGSIGFAFANPHFFGLSIWMSYPGAALLQLVALWLKFAAATSLAGWQYIEPAP